MSKQVKRKITVNLTSKSKEISKPRPSVFERLGTKAGTTQQKDFCHHWAQSGSCPYGKGCKYSSTHTLTSPSKQRAAKNQTETKHRKENAHKHSSSGNPDEEWDHWDPAELADADPDDLEKRRQELQRELELQTKMENKARKKDKKTKKESSPSTESSSTSSDSSSSSEESSSSSSSSMDARRKKNKKVKSKRDSSSSSDEKPPKKKAKTKQTLLKPAQRSDKLKKNTVKSKPVTKSPTPPRTRKQSQTPPPKIKPGALPPKSIESKSPRPKSQSSDRKDKHHTPSPRPKEREKDKEKEKERDKEKERERDNKGKERDKDREKEREKEKNKDKIKEKVREKERDLKKKEIKSPKRETKAVKEIKKRDTPDSPHSKEKKLSPSRLKGSNSRRDNHKSSPPKEERPREKKDDKDRSRVKEPRPSDDKLRNKEKRDSRDRERDRGRDRRLAREEREAAREKEREEALARCQERQRERERLKELAKKEEERNRVRDRTRREDRGLDKPSGDRVERLLPPPEDRLPPSRKHSSDRERSERRERERREKTPEKRKSLERRDEKERGAYERNYDRSRDSRDREREYGVSRIRESERRLEDKEYENPYERTRHEDRRYLDIEERYNESSREERVPLEGRDYGEERRSRRELWEARDERDLDLEHRRYPGREGSRPPASSLKGRDWETDYPDHDWDRARRPIDWEGRDNWDSSDHKHITEEDWRLYNWSGEERRRWQSDWSDRSRPRSSTSHNRDDESMSEMDAKKEPAASKRPAEGSTASPVETKKPCVVESALEDDLSEISDDADDILNRDEELNEFVPSDTTKVEITEACSSKEQQSSLGSQKSQSPIRSSPHRTQKDEAIDEENMELDFEEISEDELEEESRVKGIGDALGVDWASLVADSRPTTKPMNSAKRRWENHNVLVNLGVSVELAGEDLVRSILTEHANAEIKELNVDKVDDSKELMNSVNDQAIQISHPIGAIQVANQEKKAIRKTLLSTLGPDCRALSARRDLMIRRHLCNLPLKDTYVESPKRHDPELLKLAVNMFERCL